MTKCLWYHVGEELDSDVMEGHQDEHERLLLTLFLGFCLEAGQYPEFIVRAHVASGR